MGTINYKTSDYITMGLRPYDFSDFEKDADFVECYRENTSDADGVPPLEYIAEIIAEYENDDAENVRYYIDKHNAHYIPVKIEYGYYDGFSLLLDPDFDFTDESDRADAMAEADALRDVLRDCAGCGLVSCRPGWCTAYDDYNGTLKAIDAAIENMKKDIAAAETFEQYELKNALTF